jgi:hypothetical protein
LKKRFEFRHKLEDIELEIYDKQKRNLFFEF